MNALEYAQELVRFDSTCHLSNKEVTDYAEATLQRLGFETERIEYSDGNGVLMCNVIGRRGSGFGGLAYFGHTDVVVSNDWSISEHGPFEPTVRDARLYGRGSTDMKGSIACMLAAVESIDAASQQHPVYFCCSSDEEINHRGVVEVAERSEMFRDLVSGDACAIVGEPTRLDPVYAHKGGCQVYVTSRGKAAHSSTGEGINANLAMIPFLQVVKTLYEELESNVQWHDREFSPPTVCLNVGHNDHNAALNITSPQSVCTISFRPMPGTDAEALLATLRAAADQYGLEYELRSRNPSFRRDPESDFIRQCKQLATGNSARTVAYGSEAGNLAAVRNVVVLGPGDISEAHKSDEWISLEQLEQGQTIYRRLLLHFCT